MLRAITKPSLMTFSNIEAINFYFNANLTDFAMFSYQFNIWLTYCPMYRDYKTHGYLIKHKNHCRKRESSSGRLAPLSDALQLDHRVN